MAIVDIKELHVSFHQDGRALPAVQGVDLYIEKGECLALVGESGCGKSVSAFSLLGLCRGDVSCSGYSFDGDSVDFASDQKMKALRGGRIGIVFQDALAALDPVFRIESQMREALADPGSADARDRICKMLIEVGISDPESRMRSYPHQLSGGMRQRVMIAIALLNNPQLLIADEPTTSLDVTIQAQMLELFKKMRRDRGMALLFITHDLGIVEDIADRVAVMYAGRIVEEGPVATILSSPAHPYTAGLIQSVPGMLDQPGRFTTIAGRVPGLSEIAGISGCLFRERCSRARSECKALPELRVLESGHRCSCFFPLERG